MTFSLLAVQLSLSSAADLANEVCDQLAMIFETQLTSEGIQLTDLMVLIECELTEFAPQLGSALLKYANKAISAKVAIDLLNMHGRLQRVLESGDGSERNSHEDLNGAGFAGG